MLLTMFMTFTLTTVLYCVLLWLGSRRVARHLQANPEGVKAVMDHVLLPLLGRTAAQKTKSTVV